MNCGMECIKFLIFIFNFVFALAGLGILVLGVLIRGNQDEILSIVETNVPSDIPMNLSMPAIFLIAVGAIIFVIAFFGCCGAARESHCMIVTFAVLLLGLLVIQVVIAVFMFVNMKDGTFDENFNNRMQKIFIKAQGPVNEDQKTALIAVNTIQSVVQCCGYDSYSEFRGGIPYSCCNKKDGETCNVGEAYRNGCHKEVVPYIRSAVDRLGALAIGVAVIELIGVIFSFCLANSIRNMERRGYKV